MHHVGHQLIENVENVSRTTCVRVCETVNPGFQCPGKPQHMLYHPNMNKPSPGSM